MLLTRLRAYLCFCLCHCIKSVEMRSFSGPYFPLFSPVTGKYGPQKYPYLNTFHAVGVLKDVYVQLVNYVSSLSYLS